MSALYVRRLEIHNFMRVTGVSVDAEGKSVIIRGPNGSGKSSVVDAIFVALAGHNTKDHPEPIHQGADKGLVRLDLGEYVVERHFTPGNSRLVVKAADGSKPASPQKLLDGLLSKFALDPVAFLSRRPQDQVEDVLKVCGVEPPVAAAEEVTGESHPARPGETADQYLARLAADETDGGGGLYYVRRREEGRKVETYRGAVVKQEELVKQKQAETPEGVRPVSELLAELGQEEEAHKEYEAAELAFRVAREDLGALQENMTQVRAEREAVATQIALLQQSLTNLDSRIEKGAAFIAQATNALDAAKERKATTSSHAAKIGYLRQEITRSEHGQKALLARQQAEERLDGLKGELAKAQAEHGRLDNVLDQLRRLRAGLLEGVDLGVDGLEVGKGELRFHGVSFKQASLAQRLRVACAVAMKSGGQLRLLRIDDGEHLDKQSREFLLDLAAKQGWQVIMTCVADQEGLGVEIVDAAAPDGEGVDTQALPPEGRNGKVKTPKGKLFDTTKTAVEAGY
jgi:energy-coupling factor transporter ATP-binding protein EcfA2